MGGLHGEGMCTDTCTSVARRSGALLQLIPAALEKAMAENIEFREGLPSEYLDYTGAVNADVVSLFYTPGSTYRT